MADSTSTRGKTPSVGAVPARGGLGAHREVRPGGIALSGRRRRATGDKPAAPRELKRSGRIWLIPGALTPVVWVCLFAFRQTVNWCACVDFNAPVRSSGHDIP